MLAPRDRFRATSIRKRSAAASANTAIPASTRGYPNCANRIPAPAVAHDCSTALQNSVIADGRAALFVWHPAHQQVVESRRAHPLRRRETQEQRNRQAALRVPARSPRLQQLPPGSRRFRSPGPAVERQSASAGRHRVERSATRKRSSPIRAIEIWRSLDMYTLANGVNAATAAVHSAIDGRNAAGTDLSSCCFLTASSACGSLVRSGMRSRNSGSSPTVTIAARDYQDHPLDLRRLHHKPRRSSANGANSHKPCRPAHWCRCSLKK